MQTPRDDGPRRVLVVDDSFIMRRLVTEIVESDPDLRVCGSAENGKAALAQVRKLKPDVVLLDIEMPEMSGLETLRRLGLRSPSKVIILSSLVAEEDAAERLEALKLGAFAALGKPSGAVSLDIKERRSSEIVAAVRRASDLPALPGPGAPPRADEGRSVAEPADVGLMDALDQGVLAFDAEGRLAAGNPAARRLLAPTELSSGARIDDVFDDLNGIVAEHVWQGMRGGETLRAEIDYARPDGDWVPLRVAVSPRAGAYGKPGGVLVVLEDIGRERRMKALLDRTLSTSVADRMIAADADPHLGVDGETREVTVLFADLRDFTKLSEALGAAGMVALLNEYFSFMADVIGSQGGVIDKFIGDAIMALFGAPLSHGDDADRAVAAACDMVRALDIFNEPRRRAGLPAVRIGIGLASGPVIAGAIGSPDRLNYTVIGDAVNLASRLESQTKAYAVDILACGDTVARLTRPAPARLIDAVRVVGQTKPTQLHDITPSGPRRDHDAFASAFALYRRGRFAEAALAFERLAVADPADAAPARLLARCRALADEPPADWSGVWTLTSK